MRRLVVASVNCRPGRVRDELDDDGDWGWFYLGEDISQLIAWEHALGTDYKRYSLAARLQINAEARQPEFLQLIDELGSGYNSLGWWLGQIAEKNPYVSPLFLNICYLQTALEWLASYPDQSWLIIVEREELGKSIVAHARTLIVKDCNKWLPAPSALRMRRYLVGWLTMLRGKVLFLRDWMRLKEAFEALRIRERVSSDSALDVLLHSWIREDCQDDQGRFVDRYFGRLADELDVRGYQVQYLVLPVTVVGAWRGLSDLLRPLATQGRLFPIHRYLRWADLIAALFLPPLICNVPHGKVHLGQWDITRLIITERRTQMWSARTAQAYLHFAVSRRLAQAGKHFGRIIFTFENHIWEKALSLGVRRFNVADRLIGFQHTFIPWGYHPYFPGASEYASSVLPDRVVCNGSFWKNLLLLRGYPEVKVGAALRQGLSVEQPSGHIHKSGRSIILVCPSGGRLKTHDLLWKVHQAFADDAQWDVWIKIHPILAIDERDCNLIFNDRLPAHFLFVDQPVQELLRQVDLLIYTTTVVSYEALACGVPILAVVPELDIDRDPMRWHAIPRQVASSPVNLREKAAALLTMSSVEREAVMAAAQPIVADVFAPMSDSAVNAFLN